MISETHTLPGWCLKNCPRSSYWDDSCSSLGSFDRWTVCVESRNLKCLAAVVLVADGFADSRPGIMCQAYLARKILQMFVCFAQSLEI